VNRQAGAPLKLVFNDRKDWVLPRVLELRAKTHRDKPFIQFRDGQVATFKQVNERANRIAHGLARLGIGKGNRVLMMMPNCLDMVYCWFGTVKLGAVEVPINPAYKGYILEHVVNNCEAEVAIVAQDLLERFRDSRPELRHLKHIVVWSPDAKSTGDSAGLSACYELLPFQTICDACTDNPQVDLAYYDLASISYTSGTTGASKGALITHSGAHLLAESDADFVRLTEQDVYYTSDPLFHVNAKCGLYGCMIIGAKLLLDDQFSATQWIAKIRSGGATVAKLLGGMAEFIYRQPERPDDADNKLKALVTIPTPAEIFDSFKKRFGVDVLLDQYGLTETGNITATPYGMDRPLGSCGRPRTDFWEVRIVDPVTREGLPPGQVGELLIRPKVPWTIAQGYNGMSEQTAEAWIDGWFRTGDALMMDEEGWFFFVDRIKDSIRRRGENISSFEVEKVIYANHAVFECAVIPVKSQTKGGEDEVMACVVLKPGHTLTPEQLVDWCDDRMPYFSVPRYVEFFDSLPKTATQKVRKLELRSRGVSPATWDRVKVGYKTKEEIKREQRKAERRGQAAFS